MTLLVRNEEDVVEENLLYHLNRGVDYVVATDNASDDSTRDILAEYERQGVLHLIDEPTHSYDQGRWVTGMARMAATDFGADWIINNDADEFFWPDAGDLKDVLAEIPERFGVLTVPRTNFLPRPESEEGGSVVDRMVVRERHSFTTSGEAKRLPPKAVHRAHPEVSVENGGHRLAAPGLVTLDGWHPIETFHFPVRTYAQWETKIRIAYEARSSANLNVPSAVGVGATLLEAGRLHEAYDEQALDDQQVEAGLREGRLVLDRRLQRFLAGVRERAAAGAPAAGGVAVVEADEDLGGRSDALARAINAQGHHPIRRPKIGTLRARAEEGDRAVRRLRQIEATRWWRLGQRVESAVARVRDAGRGGGGGNRSPRRGRASGRRPTPSRL